MKILGRKCEKIVFGVFLKKKKKKKKKKKRKKGFFPPSSLLSLLFFFVSSSLSPPPAFLVERRRSLFIQVPGPTTSVLVSFLPQSSKASISSSLLHQPFLHLGGERSNKQATTIVNNNMHSTTATVQLIQLLFSRCHLWHNALH